jgi:hypothetical protein
MLHPLELAPLLKKPRWTEKELRELAEEDGDIDAAKRLVPRWFFALPADSDELRGPGLNPGWFTLVNGKLPLCPWCGGAPWKSKFGCNRCARRTGVGGAYCFY